jgi:hypothetical protein
LAEQLTRDDRRQVLAALERIGDELGPISTWLSGLDLDQPSILLEEAWRDGAAAGWSRGQAQGRPCQRLAGCVYWTTRPIWPMLRSVTALSCTFSVSSAAGMP